MVEPTYKETVEDWFGTRFFFEKKKRFVIEILEVTVFKEELGTTYRYGIHSPKGIYFANGTSDNLYDDTVPYWMRSILFRFFR